MTHERRALVLMATFVALWALVEELAAHVLRHYSPFQVVWTRYAVHLAFMLAIWGWREPATLWRTRRPGYQLARSMLMVGMPACWIFSLQLGASDSAFFSIFWLSPLIVVALARIFLRERVDAMYWMAAGAASVGAILVVRWHGIPGVLQASLALGMALCFSGYVVMTRPLRHESTRANLFYTALGPFAVLTPAMPMLWITPSAHDLAILAGVGLLGYAGLYALDRAAAAAPVLLSAPVTATQLLFTALLGVVLGNRLPGVEALAGLAIIAAAAAFVWARSPGNPGSLARSNPA